MNTYSGTIIAESLEDQTVLGHVKIVSTTVEPAEEEDATPWLKQWTLHKVEIPGEQAATIAQELSRSLDREHGGSWYADFQNEDQHYVIFRDKVFHVDKSHPEEYAAVKEYGRSLGIPEHQLDFV